MHPGIGKPAGKLGIDRTCFGHWRSSSCSGCNEQRIISQSGTPTILICRPTELGSDSHRAKVSVLPMIPDDGGECPPLKK